jgi:ribosomal protein L11 methyltransferase
MDYQESRVYTTTTGVEAVYACLMRHGIDSVAVADAADVRSIMDEKDRLGWDYIEPALMENMDGEAVLSFYTPNDPSGWSLLAEIKTDLLKLKGEEQYGLFGADADFGRLYVETQFLDDSWKDKWKAHFKPFAMTEHFVVCPPWETYQGESETIILDPGMAFGLGSHETTAMCAEALEAARLEGRWVLDVGTGSGILAIAAAKLGAGRVLALEVDADAFKVAQSNIAANDVSAKIELQQGNILDWEHGSAGLPDMAGGGQDGKAGAQNITNGDLSAGVRGESRAGSLDAAGVDLLADRMSGSGSGRLFDVVVGNLAGPLIHAALPILKNCVKSGGRLILSGLLDIEETALKAALDAQGAADISVQRRGEWIAVCAVFL